MSNATTMSDANTTERRIILGDPVPWFSAPVIGGSLFDLHVFGGRWVVLAFLGSPQDPCADQVIAALRHDADLFDDDRIVVRGVFTTPPADIAKYAAISSKAFSFVIDQGGVISHAYGAGSMPRTIVLDPLLRAIADVPWDFPAGHAKTLHDVLRGLPSVEDSAGVPLTAPTLIVPRVFDFPLCEFLVQFYEQNGGEDSGFYLDVDGKTTVAVDYRLKRRNDLVLAHPQVREIVRSQISRRLLPPLERYFQFAATRIDRYVVACYDSAIGGHFYRHRDNMNAGAEHRRFAVSINLNKDYDGCDVIFPEFGRRAYRAPYGGAIVFSCGALHEVTPVTRGRRYAFLTFLYGEADAAKREANNARLHDEDLHYTGAFDRLFPERAA
jgi:predicted 2-oxoglutarate/Fe(II)-dependent dioxygenase YbiX/peroxiredoxin